MKSKSHDLFDFMQSMSQEIASEYNRIQKRALDDPGTAGDQGEENWAEILRKWLPPLYQVVTKGRILFSDGFSSPQVDILVLHPAYPKGLHRTKLYLAAGVVAAFECKVTLRPRHIDKVIENAAIIKRHSPIRLGSPYKELNSSILYGLLAHSHMWKAERSQPLDNIENRLIKADQAYAQHPREMLDLLCVADLGSWTASKTPWVRPENVVDWDQNRPWPDLNGSPCTTFMSYSDLGLIRSVSHPSTPIGAVVTFLLRQLAWNDPNIRGLADYFHLVGLMGAGRGFTRWWSLNIYSEAIRHEVPLRAPPVESYNKNWDEWGEST